MYAYARSLFTFALVVLTGYQLASPASSISRTVMESGSADGASPAGNTAIESLDGKGNNLANPDWGSADQQFLRLAQPAYGDGLNSPAGADRPSARLVSNTFSAGPKDGILNDRHFSAFVYAWGQFLDHDIDLTAAASTPEAFPISVPKGDAWFDPQGSGVMTIPFSRSGFDPATGVHSPRQQVNAITAFIDGSQIYGSDAVRSAALREFVGGRLKAGSGDLLPFNTAKLANANDAHLVDDASLFLAGDVRANENPELISLQTLFMREHNRLAAQIAARHPAWTDEQIFQEARRTVIAELQKITYDEFLPALLGSHALPNYSGYHPDVNPGIATEFATAAFRFGHSMVGDDIEFLDNNGKEIREALPFQDAFFNPKVVSETGIDPILKYLASDDAQEVDPIVVDDLRDFLFGQPGQGGFDLAALNIQRGRDHGLPDYNSVRVAYGLPRVTRFDQISSDKALQTKLAGTYGSVDRIDLWIGGLAEDHLPNSSLGPTFTKILVDQFTRLRDGDRFWYENVLSGQRLREIEDLSLADVIRRNTTLTKLQANVFFYDPATTVMLDSSLQPVAQPEPLEAGPTDRRPGERRPPPPGRPPRRR